MAHILCRIRRVKIEDVKAALKRDAKAHAAHGLKVEYVWRDLDDKDEVYFLFKADNLLKAKAYILKTQEQAKKDNSKVNLPVLTYLE